MDSAVILTRSNSWVARRGRFFVRMDMCLSPQLNTLFSGLSRFAPRSGESSGPKVRPRVPEYQRCHSSSTPARHCRTAVCARRISEKLIASSPSVRNANGAATLDRPATRSAKHASGTDIVTHPPRRAEVSACVASSIAPPATPQPVSAAWDVAEHRTPTCTLSPGGCSTRKRAWTTSPRRAAARHLRKAATLGLRISWS